MPCEKKPYDSEAQANRAAKGYAKMKGGRKQRSYFCDDCRAFHLTTTPQNKRRRRTRDKFRAREPVEVLY